MNILALIGGAQTGSMQSGFALSGSMPSGTAFGKSSGVLSGAPLDTMSSGRSSSSTELESAYYSYLTEKDSEKREALLEAYVSKLSAYGTGKPE